MTTSIKLRGVVDAEVSWSVRPPAPPAVVSEMMRDLGVDPVMASVLWRRGLGADAAELLHSPLVRCAVPGMDEAAAALERAVRERARILVHGDYDADGITGTALLTLGLRALGGQVTPYLPDRLTDGYGVCAERLEEHADAADLFVTVDCGITNLDEIRTLRAAGVDTIVTDHHTPGDDVPEGIVVHPALSQRAGGASGGATPGTGHGLTGAGIAFHLLWTLHERLGLEAPFDYADIATIGTIADVAPLLGDNRALAQEGLRRLPETRWAGLRAAVKQSSLREPITARDVAFVLAPRLNAAGRLGEAEKGLELLLTASERRARELAAYLDARNDDRRKIQDEMFAEALERIDPEAPAIVVGDDAWHPGVMGIVASKLLEHVYRPVFIHAKGKGSVRSTPGISAVAALRAAAHHLTRFGGHAQAAGFALERAAVGGFRDAVIDFVGRHPTPQRTIVADALLCPADVDPGLLRTVVDLEPFGEGHPAPVFALTGPLDTARAVGRDGNTLQLRVGGVKGVAWGRGGEATDLMRATTVTAMAELRENEWNGQRSVEFLAHDVRELAPLRCDTSTHGSTVASFSSRTSAPPDRALRFTRVGGGSRPAPHSPAGAAGAAAPRSTGRAAGPERVEGTGNAPARVPLAGGAPVRVTSLPLTDDCLGATAAIRELLAHAEPVEFDLDRAGLAEIERRLDALPTVHDVRLAFVSKQRGQRLPFAPAKTQLVAVIFDELDLLDELGRARRGIQRDPYASATLRKALLERYALRTFVEGYRVLDDRAFDEMVTILFVDPPPA